MAEDDLVYLLRRAADERERAERAVDPAAKAAHGGMAEAYDRRIHQHSAGKVSPIRS